MNNKMNNKMNNQRNGMRNQPSANQNNQGLSSQLSPNALNNLLSIASSKLGTSPEVLKSQLENGKFDKAMEGIPQNESNQLMSALSNPQMAKKILSSPQAQAIFKKLNEN